MDPNSTQARMNEIQRNESFASAFSKIVSGKSGYKAVIEKKPQIIKCKKCGASFENPVKFCNECGTKIFIKPIICPKCSKPVFADDKFCQDCGQSLEDPDK